MNSNASRLMVEQMVIGDQLRTTLPFGLMVNWQRDASGWNVTVFVDGRRMFCGTRATAEDAFRAITRYIDSRC